MRSAPSVGAVGVINIIFGGANSTPVSSQTSDAANQSTENAVVQVSTAAVLPVGGYVFAEVANSTTATLNFSAEL